MHSIYCVSILVFIIVLSNSLKIQIGGCHVRCPRSSTGLFYRNRRISVTDNRAVVLKKSLMCVHLAPSLNTADLDRSGTLDSPLTDRKKEIKYPIGTKFFQCGQCKSAYIMNFTEIKSGSRVKCSVCSKVWFQSTDKLSEVTSTLSLKERGGDLTKSAGNLTNSAYSYGSSNEKVSIFIGDLPLEFTEKEVGDLFAEYGLLHMVVAKDQNKVSRGFAFIEVGIFLKKYLFAVY
jgi:hypothetical protein